jgi:hypothetical protein
MNKSIIDLLGLADDGKRIYHFEAGEIDREEFQYSVVMFNYLFDDQMGVIATLGPTWNLVHDPRFTAIENAFIRKRQARLGGDSTLGRQKIGPFGALTGSVQDLDQYATILGEGRHFRQVILKNFKDYENGVIINGAFLDEDGDPIHPDTLSQDSDEVLWNVIKQECPNYFTRAGQPNLEATRLFNLFRLGLVELVGDYAEVPLVDEIVFLDSGEVVEDENTINLEEQPIIALEVDLLEKALTVRASLRVMAAQILERMGFASKINETERLTDFEIDHLLRIVYTSDWPENRLAMVKQIIEFITSVNTTSYGKRLEQQTYLLKVASKDIVAKIKSGDIKRINRYTDPADDQHTDPDAAAYRSIQENPYKRDLLDAYIRAERTGQTAIVDIIRPVFESPAFILDEETFKTIVRQIKAIYVGPGTSTVTGECEAAVEPYWNSEIHEMTKLCRKTLPCPFHDNTTRAAQVKLR